MLRGMYGAAAGMLAQQQRQEMLTNNLANVQTPGYKADQATIRAFPSMMLAAMNTSSGPMNQNKVIGELATGVYVQEHVPNFKQGDLNQTGNTTDLALLQGVLPEGENGVQGGLFFTVTGDDGALRYTRNGQFTVDGEGVLTTSSGHRVLGTDGQALEVGNTSFSVNENGVILSNEGDIIGQLGIVYVENPLDLTREGNGLLTYSGEEAEDFPQAIGMDDITYQIQQGFVEKSNVDPTQTMAEMMSAYRAFEANQRVLQAYDQSLQKAVNEIGRLG
ncbi:flagellar basal body rod protein subunit C [Alkalihalobacillus alcalophilus ATCC 27647 = CGMCC 1.3604]|uniref:Flagellar basal body rod protein FlgC n=1 Tax=Alkalihalobacillus alcalophilus ATCC 27647 = CGMCC 1.3604 TaxID=1218173 RepID=A0A094WM70_ALKAL|nr:flagellar hook-basal body protein [Alkalihalobacillus alcalophilus]KGA97068.1 flagellar basal body rod protein FlgC [Alkalihalobacillus alcalophilus ATCC 27647 = CGMCC 1.3604]MED1561095.1 flagellar hook-basal body protein [Alkalihalobacillus alcalophilus]THG90161.1 flagellar basal body rod protein subunit C [Alkalihalobacillus alcalophilus ATCC 27647 = CGMCC 1.3604]